MRPSAGCLSVLAMALLLGCEDDRPPPPRGIVTPNGGAPAEEAAAPATEDPFVRPVREDAPEEPPPAEVAPPPPQPRLDPEADVAALRASIGDPSGCVRSSASAPAQVDVDVRVRVSTSGVVTDATVAAPGLSEADVACIERRAGAVRLPPGAPRSAATTFTLRR